MIESFQAWFVRYLPNIGFAIVVIIGAGIIEFLIDDIYKRYRAKYGTKYGVQITETGLRLFVFFVAMLLLLSSIPGITNNAVRLVFAAIGIIVALSSTTMIANGMSGVLIRILGSYKVGDMVKIIGHIGKVSEIGIFHTEIQTPKRGLITVPNNIVLREPFLNYTTSKYIVNVPITIGYDIERKHVEDLLIKALNNTGLKDPFVFITNLDNYWVEYEANGLLEDTTQLVIIESNLRKNILDRFNEAGVEILSPTFMLRKEIPVNKKAIPEKYGWGILEKKESKQKIEAEAKKAESVMFEKAKKEEEKAKREEMDKLHLLETMKANAAEREKVKKWIRSKKIKVAKGTTSEDIIGILATNDNVNLEDMKQFFEGTEEEEKKESSQK